MVSSNRVCKKKKKKKKKKLMSTGSFENVMNETILKSYIYYVCIKKIWQK